MEIVRFALLGLASGAIYAVLAQGLVLVYRGSGLLNFAQGAIAMVGAYVYYELVVKLQLPQGVALIVAIAACAALGAAIHVGILRPMCESSPLSRVIVTLAILVSLQSAASIIYGSYPRALPSLLPTQTVHVFARQLPIGVDHIIIFMIGVVLTAALHFLYRLTAFGRITAAVAQDQVVAASLGFSPDRIAATNWALASGLAGLAGVLIAPLIYLEPSGLVGLVLPAITAALLGGFSSFPLTLMMALAIGVAESEITRYVSAPGWPTAAPFIAVMAIVILRGRALPLRSFVSDRLPAVSRGRIRPLVAIGAVALAVLALAAAGSTWTIALTTTFAVAIICLSVVVITGYAGQLSLAQYVLAGVGALVAAKLASNLAFPIAVVLGATATAVLAGAVGLPALRTRGIMLAIVTFGLGASVVAVVLNNPTYTGGISGITVPVPHLFGWDIDPFAHPSRYALVVLAVASGLCLAVMNLRRGAVGRRLLAIRSNERAATACGVNVAGLKSYAFVLAGLIAGTGGILLAFMQPSVIVSSFDLPTSILVTAVTVAGGVGAIGGAWIGAILIPGGVVSQLFSGSATINEYLPLIGGLVLIVALRADADGLLHLGLRGLSRLEAAANPIASRTVRRLSGTRNGRRRDRRDEESSAAFQPRLVIPRALRVLGVTVSYGGSQALRAVSLDVRPGEVHGLIGPNGAGKTTLIDAITGFTNTAAGSVLLGDRELTPVTPRGRARAGLARSFQSLELFNDLTVLENIAVACEEPRVWRYVLDLFRPRGPRLSDGARYAFRKFELADVADRKPDQLSFGRRKELAIARAIARAPSVLLLDEPAAGLDDHEAADLADLIRRLAHDYGIGVLLVEHRIDMIMEISDRVTVLVGGECLTSGTPIAVRSDPRVLDAYLGQIGEPSPDSEQASTHATKHTS